MLNFDNLEEYSIGTGTMLREPRVACGRGFCSCTVTGEMTGWGVPTIKGKAWGTTAGSEGSEEFTEVKSSRVHIRCFRFS